MDILCNNINCDGIGMKRSDWDNFRECERIMLNGQQIWGYPLSDAVKSQIYEDIVTTGHHSASLASEVWRAANLYCKSHAASHPELTAQGKLLSAFVNADKDMYCSLPLALTPEAQSALPTRWLVGDSYAYINPHIEGFDLSASAKCKFKMNKIGDGTLGVFGEYYNGAKNFRLYASANRYLVFQYKDNIIQNLDGTNPYINKVYEFEIKDGKIYLNGVQVRTYTKVSITSPVEPIIGCTLAGNTSLVEPILEWPGDNKEIWIALQEINNHIFIPCLNTQTNKYGMLDLNDLQWYGNAAATGSFTIEKS